MNTKIYPFLLFFFYSLTSYNTTLAQVDIAALSSSVREIESNGNNFEQELIQIKGGDPNEILFTRITTDRKGRSSTESFEFNLIDLDSRLLRRDVKAKTMYLTIKTSDNQKMIKYFKDGDQENYRNYFAIAVDGVDDSRAMEVLFEAAIKEAKKVEKTDFKTLSLDAQLDLLKNAVKTVRINDSDYAQTLEIGSPQYLLTLNVEDETTKTSTSTSSTFSLSDLLEKSIKIAVSGKKLMVQASCFNNQRRIQNFEDGNFKNFGNKVEIVVNNTNEARTIAHVLKVLIKTGRQLEKEKMEGLASDLAGRTDLISKLIKDIQTEKKDVKQSVQGDCVLNYSQTTLASSDKSTINEYYFNLIDFEKKKSQIKTSSSSLSVTLSSEKRLVKHERDGDVQNYKSEVAFFLDDLEEAKTLAFVLEKQIGACQDQQANQKLAGGSAQSLLENCAKYISNIELSTYSYKQSLKAVDNVPCKLELTQVKSDKNKDSEVLYEFNLSDITPKTIDFAISGKNLSLKLNTKNREKVIKRYLSDEKSDYVDSLNFFMDDVENTRKLIGLFKELVHACAE